MIWISMFFFPYCRGADLINKNLLDRLRVQKEQEQQIVQNIKTKMDKIRERHAHFQPPGYKEPTDHYEGKSSRQVTKSQRTIVKVSPAAGL